LVVEKEGMATVPGVVKKRVQNRRKGKGGGKLTHKSQKCMTGYGPSAQKKREN